MDGTDAVRDVGSLIRDEIARGGPITFARYMALALYHPTLGYYAGGGIGHEPLGWSGDYFTSSDVSPLWGWALARQLREMWELLGSPPRYDVIEVGAGRGLLAREVWRFARFSAPEWGEALHYTLVDSAAAEGAASGDRPLLQAVGETGPAPTTGDSISLFGARRAKLADDLAQLGVAEERVHWVGSLRDLPAIHQPAGPGAPHVAGEGVGGEAATSSAFLPREGGQGVRLGGGGITGVILSNELIDALAVHIVQVVGDATPHLAEVYVDLDASGRLAERLEAPSSPQVAAYLDGFGVPWRTYGDGWRAEVCLAAEQWMREAADMLGRGFLLTIDYGASARRLYTRDRRHGMLAVYSRHQFGDRPLASPGQKDITAHVNFSALARVGCQQGVAVAGYTTQAAFLRRLGVMEAARMLSQRLYPEADADRQSDRGQAAVLRRRMLEGAAATLLDPRGLGGFRVLVQQRGVPHAAHELTGLRRG